MSVLNENTNAVLMLCAAITRDRTVVHVNLDFLEMDALAKVEFCLVIILTKNIVTNKEYLIFYKRVSSLCEVYFQILMSVL